MKIRKLFVGLGIVALSVAGIVSPVEATTARTPVVCETHGYYNKKTNTTVVRVTTNKPTSKKKFDYRLQFINKRGDIEAIWVKNQGMKITVKGEFPGGYAYQGVDQCAPYGEGVG